MPTETRVDVAVVGAGIAGIATAYYLCVRQGIESLLLIDSRQPMSFTSAQSGDNYRNWWPHPTMADFTNRSIDLFCRGDIVFDHPQRFSPYGFQKAIRYVRIDLFSN